MIRTTSHPVLPDVIEIQSVSWKTRSRARTFVRRISEVRSLLLKGRPVGGNDIPAWSVIAIAISADETVRVNGEPVPVAPGEDSRAAALAVVAEFARAGGRPVRADASEADGTVFPLLVFEDGTASEAGPPVAPRPMAREHTPAPPTAVPFSSEPAVPPAPSFPPRPSARPSVPPAPTPFSPRDRETAATPPEFPEVSVSWSSAGVAEPTARSGPVRQRAYTAAGLPAPEPEQWRAIEVIRAAIRSGDTAVALAEAEAFDARHATAVDPAERLAAREVHAYTALVAGRPERAVTLYADAARLGRDFAEPGDWPARMIENAHFCWLHVLDPDAARESGRLLMDAYAVAGAANSPAATAARERWRLLASTVSI